jgi:hypothetical protein
LLVLTEGIKEWRLPAPTVRFLMAAGLVLVTVGAVALLWPKKPSAAARALDAKLAQLRAGGVPLTAAEMGKMIPDPDPEHDAHHVLREAFAVGHGPAGGDVPIVSRGVMPPRTQPFAESTMQSMAVYLTDADTALARIPDDLQGIWFSMGWARGFTNLSAIPFTKIRSLLHLLTVKAIYEAERGDGRKAAEALSKGFAVTGTLNGDSLVSAMVRVACAGILCDATERVLNRVALSDADLVAISQSIGLARVDDFEATFMAERHMGIFAFDGVRGAYQRNRAIKMMIWKVAQWFRRNRQPLYRDEDYLVFLNVIDELQRARRLPGMDRVRRQEQLIQYYTNNTRSIMANMVMPNWTKAMRTATETEAQLVTLKTALAVERYRLAHNGALLETLEALVPQYLPSPARDPMDEQPLRFKKLPRGYVVYSIGVDGVDNGGTERAGLTNNYDVTITIERASPMATSP